MTEERFPEFIVALPVKPAEKLAMIGGTNGMVFAINNPHYPLRSWYLDPKEMAGDTSHIVKVIKEQDIEIDEVVEMLTRVYDKVLEADLHPKLYCRSSNITCRYATIVQKGIEEARQKRLLTREEVD